VSEEVIVFDQSNILFVDSFSTIMHLHKNRLRQVCEGYGAVVDAEQTVSEWARSNVRINYHHIGHFYQEEPIVQDALCSNGNMKKDKRSARIEETPRLLLVFVRSI
jgi:hypothetical protein